MKIYILALSTVREGFNMRDFIIDAACALRVFLSLFVILSSFVIPKLFTHWSHVVFYILFICLFIPLNVRVYKLMDIRMQRTGNEKVSKKKVTE